MWHSLYFLTYAIVATISGIVITWAQWARYKKEKTPINFTLISVVLFAALAMWIGAFFTIYAYENSATAVGIGAFLIGLTFSIFIAWQVNKIMRGIEKDKKVIEELSTKDSLTGLLNRRMFHEHLEQEFDYSQKYKQPLSVMMYEIDQLPDVNEKYGYRGGDMVLRELGDRFRESVSVIRSIDIACRFRSDKLAVIFPQTEAYEAEVVAKRVQSLVEDEPFKVSDTETAKITISVGISSLYPRTQSDDDLISEALKAVRAARADGDNNMYLFTEDKEMKPL